MDNELFHYGTPHVGNVPHSGRYPYGSGDPKEGSWNAQMDFLDRYEKLKSTGKSEKEMADEFGLSIKDFRDKRAIAQAEIKASLVTRARRLKDHGNSVARISEIMGVPDSTVRGWLKNQEASRKDKIDGVADVLE